MKKVFVIDLALYPLGLMTAVTGFGFHIAGHDNNHQIWELCAFVHILISAIFVYLVIQHLYTHKAWTKGLRDETLRKKRQITILLAVLAFAVTATGIMLLGIMGANTHVGLLHYKLGIVFTLLLIGHSVRRLHVLRRVFNK